MDEPLSALDKQAKEEILPYFERLANHLSLPIILVSHDLSEVERLADHLVSLQQGRVRSSSALSDALIDSHLPFSQSQDKIGRASCREGVELSEVVALEYHA